jgi:asparagine synthase (glutamine-hydrolysing)
MCGVAGFLSSERQEPEAAESAVLRMAGAVHRRGPDDEGTWVDAEAGIALGHRRLAIVDLTAAGHQPMISPSGRFVISFNGEIYNHEELRRLLRSAGREPVWRGHSDTESLLAAFEHWGVADTLTKAVGMFAIALWDRQTGTLTLARDRAGEKPLYYGWQGNTFLFGSELKALKAHSHFSADVARSSLILLLRHNFIPAPYSIYEGIHKLPAGTSLQVSLRQRSSEPTPYWSLRDVAERGTANQFAGSDADAVNGLESVLSRAVTGQMMSDVPLGALLSGGLDSTTVASLMQASSQRPIRTFTIGFDEREYDEANHARAVARHLGTDHTEIRLSGGDAQALVPQIPTIYDEPFADSSQLPTHLVMKLARQHVTVALSGDAGDELFGGYTRYMHAPALWKRLGWLPYPMRKAFGAALQAFPAESINYLVGPLAQRAGLAHPGDKAHKLGRRLEQVQDLDDFCVSLQTEWPKPEEMVVGGRMPPDLLDDRSRWPQLTDPAARMMALDTLLYLPDDILVKVDRAAMAVSLETRAPFLDRDVIEFAWSLPMHMKIRNGQGKWLIRQLLDRYVPRSLVERPKMGFAIPLDTWLRGPLRDWAEDLLDSVRLRREGYFQVAQIRSAWEAHLNGHAANGHRLWSVLMFQAWLQENA